MPGKHTPSAHKTQSVSEKLAPRKSASRPPMEKSLNMEYKLKNGLTFNGEEQPIGSVIQPLNGIMPPSYDENKYHGHPSALYMADLRG